MLIDLHGRTALVTGSTQGIGRAIAATLADAGARVAINGRRAESVDSVIDELRAESPQRVLVAAPGDVADVTGADAVLSAVGHVDVLVNNLGIFVAEPALDITDDEWRRYFEVNVLAAVRLIRATLPGMKERGWGRVLNIASDSAIVIPAEMIHYGMSKTALLAVSRGFAKDAAGTGVTVSSVIAGPTHTGGVESFVYELVDPALPWDEAQREFMRLHRPQSLLQRLIEPQEIANMVAYLSSPRLGDDGRSSARRRRVRGLDPAVTRPRAALNRAARPGPRRQARGGTRRSTNLAWCRTSSTRCPKAQNPVSSR